MPTGAAGSTWGPRDLLVAGLCTLRVLRANMYHLRAAGVSPGTVGLGTSSSPNCSSGGRRDRSGSGAEQKRRERSPFAAGLLSLLLDYAGGVLDVIPSVKGDEDDESVGGGGTLLAGAVRPGVVEDNEEMSALRRAVRYEAAEVVGRGLEFFLPDAADRVSLLSALLRQTCADDGGVENCEETKEEDGQDKPKSRESRSASAVAEAAAMADGPLPVDMDEEGCGALLSAVCGAICSDPDLLLSLVPEVVRPPLTVRDVPSYVASKLRSAEKAQAQALQNRLLKEAASAASSTSPGSGAAGGTAPAGSGSPRPVPPSRTRGGAAGDADDADGLGLWKTGPTAGLPRTGDVVVRGPDWAWGAQDGEPGGRGLVVGLATWGRAAARRGDGRGPASLGPGDRADQHQQHQQRGDRNAVRVMWEKGAINVYRWGAVGRSPASVSSSAAGYSANSDDGRRKPCYDLKVLRAPAIIQGDAARGEGGGKATTGGGESGKGGGKSEKGDKGHHTSGAAGKGHAVRGELKWSVADVDAALLPQGDVKDKGSGRGEQSGDTAAPTAREVLRFIKNNAPQEWREPRRITGAENALVKVSVI